MKSELQPMDDISQLDRFSYFMVRVQQRHGESGFEGVIEQLSTGEKRSFASAVMLLEMIGFFLAAPLGTKE